MLPLEFISRALKLKVNIPLLTGVALQERICIGINKTDYDQIGRPGINVEIYESKSGSESIK